MNGVKMSNCKFYVNEEKRIVICVIPNTKRMFTKFVQDHFSWNDVDLDSAAGYGTLRDSLMMPGSFRGVAVCAPEDEWNEETGRMIAFNRAKTKCYNSFFKRAQALMDALDKRMAEAVEMLNNFGDKINSKSIALQEEIENRVGK